MGRGRDDYDSRGGGSPPPSSADDASVEWERALRTRTVVPSPVGGQRKKLLEPYRLTLRAVQSVSVPERFAVEAEHANPDDVGAPQLFHRLSASFFDTDEKRFFGRTFESPEMPLPSGSALFRPTDVEHDLELYFHSPLQGPRVVIVVEHAIVMRRAGVSTAPVEHGAGWALLYPFDPAGRLRDSSESSGGGRGGYDNSQPPLDLYNGSPLALMQLQQPYDRSPFLQRSSASLVYSLRTHRALKPAIHLLSPDVFYSTTPPIPGLLPSREPSSQGGRLLPCPLGRVDSKSLQVSCRLTASQIRLTLPTALETEAAKLAYTQMQPPPPRGGRPPNPPAKLTTGQRRLLIALHSTYAICADKSAQAAPPPSAPSADGRKVEPPPGSLVAPKSLNLEEVRERGAPSTGQLVLRPANNSSAALDGFVNSASVACVLELQVEVTLPPPPGKPYERRTKWITLAWGCYVPCAHADRPNMLPPFPARARLEMRFGTSGKPSPLSFERLPDGGSALKALRSADTPIAELELTPVAGSNMKQMERELESADADESARIASDEAKVAAKKFLVEQAEAEKAFEKAFVSFDGAPADDRDPRDDRRDDRRDARRDDRGGDRRDDRRADDSSREPDRRDQSREPPDQRDQSREPERGRDERSSRFDPARPGGQRDEPSRDRKDDRSREPDRRDDRSSSRDPPERRDDRFREYNALPTLAFLASPVSVHEHRPPWVSLPP